MTSATRTDEQHPSSRSRVVWINGAFGVGKTTTARLLLQAFPEAVLFDPEEVGALLRPVLQPVAAVQDFQMWSAWRDLVAATINAVAHELPDEGSRLVIVPQTVTNESYWLQIRTAIDPQIDVTCVALHVDPGEHQRRVNDDSEEPGALRWRIANFEGFDAAEWVRASFESVDTSTLSPEAVAAAVQTILDTRQGPLT